MVMTGEGKRLSLVLGSGGARGLAHIGVIRLLKERGYRIESIAGCSMGALVGGIYAAGRLDDYERWVRQIDRMGIFSILDFSFGRGGLVKGERLIATLRELVGETRIEELPIRFTAVAADIAREREVWINRGPLFDAVRASISMPLFFTPYRYEGVTLIDGSIFNPVPVAPTFHDLTDLTVAVNLNGPAEEGGEEPAVEPPPPETGLAAFTARVRDFFARDKEEREVGEERSWDMFYVLSQSLDAMHGVIARQKLAAHPPDVVIDIPRNACGMLEFDRADEMIALGYARAQERLARLAE
jgi:NTE family protein